MGGIFEVDRRQKTALKYPVLPISILIVYMGQLSVALEISKSDSECKSYDGAVLGLVMRLRTIVFLFS